MVVLTKLLFGAFGPHHARRHDMHHPPSLNGMIDSDVLIPCPGKQYAIGENISASFGRMKVKRRLMHISKKLNQERPRHKMNDKKNRVCPVSLAGGLDNRIRRMIQNPEAILSPYVSKGMTVLDVGCGPGFFSIAFGGLVGDSGRVIAADLQEGMLEKLRNKITGTELEKRIRLHQCKPDGINLSEQVDLVLAFYMVHEVPDQLRFFEEIFSILKQGGQFLLVEPKLFHVSKQAFEETLKRAGTAGFEPMEGPKVRFSWSAVLRKGNGKYKR
jgi:ubiquinone/menaquinone biosynthesis C-methylase UbiE